MYNMGIFETEQSYHLRKRILLMIKCKKILKLSLKGFFFHQGNEHFPFVIQTKRSQLRLTLMIGH